MENTTNESSVVTSNTDNLNTSRKRKTTLEKKEFTPMSQLPVSTVLSFIGIQGPTVEVYLKSDPTKKYTLSKDLLCTRSSFFDACFNGNFQESTTQTVHLDSEIQALHFEMLLKWLFTDSASSLPKPFSLDFNWTEENYLEEDFKVFAKKMDNFHESLSEHLEFVLLGQSLLFDPSPSKHLAKVLSQQFFKSSEFYIQNRGFYGPLLPSHIEQAWQLPEGDPMRILFTRVTTQMYLNDGQKKNFIYKTELKSVEGFAEEVLMCYRETVVEGVEAHFRKWADENGEDDLEDEDLPSVFLTGPMVDDVGILLC